MDKIPSSSFVNLGNLLVSEDYKYPVNNSSIVETDYKQNYITKLNKQLDALQKDNTELMDAYHSLGCEQANLTEKIDRLTKKILINKKYNNSATNFVLSHNQRMNKKLEDMIATYNCNRKKLDNINTELEIIKFSIYKTKQYLLLG
jgi:predicted RNase H-like nuclease (RuvC/YqgF family)